jgi:hypothetical protein
MNAIRREARSCVSTALDLALKLTRDTRLARKLARLVLHLAAQPLMARDLGGVTQRRKAK